MAWTANIGDLDNTTTIKLSGVKDTDQAIKEANRILRKTKFDKEIKYSRVVNILKHKKIIWDNIKGKFVE